jgi:general secretion pathway protein D
MKPLLLALSVFACARGAQASTALEPSELIVEVIPIKYARAADVSTALLKMSTNGVVATPAAATRNANPSLAIPGSPMVLADAPQNTGMSSIIADERTNTLLIHATRENMRRFKEAISQLDIAAVQVLIEAAIIEVEDHDTNIPALVLGEGKTPEPGNAAAAEPHGFGYLAKPDKDFDSLLSTLAGDSRFKILQRPRIQTSDGVRASMFVGQMQPSSTHSSSQTGATGSDSSSRPSPIGVTFEVTPVINKDGYVIMDIHQKIDRLTGTVTIANVGEVPVTSTTEAQTKVTVRDRETVLLGGLREAPLSATNSGTSLPEQIPLLDAPASRSSPHAASKEILVLIRPTVLPKREAALER